MIVSVTEVESFKRCRRAWDYGSFNRQALTPIIQSKPYLDLGSMVHKALAYWTQKPNSNLTHVFDAVSIQHYNKVWEQYKAKTGSTPTEEETQPLQDAITLGGAMMANYQEYYKQPLPSHLTFCSPEQEIWIPIPGTEYNCCILQTLEGSAPCESCNGTGIGRHYLKARLDALAQDSHGNVYVVERKTYDKRPNLSLLERSDQFVGYVWVAQQLNIGPVIGIAYDGLWKRDKPPQKPKKLPIDALFCRAIIEPAQDEINEYGRELAETVQDMANQPRLYKNRVWQGCWDCSFEYLCGIQSMDGDYKGIIETQFMRRTEDDVSDIAAQVESAGAIA